MDFKQLESFVAVVDEGGFSNAAERLQLSQSMVTIHVRNLENELGTRLLNRSTRSMELSVDGQTFYYYAKQILKLNADSVFSLAHAGQDENTIGIITTPYTARYYLAQRIAAFKREYPGARFNVVEVPNEEAASKLHAGEYQFVLSNTKFTDSDYTVKCCATSDLVAVTPKLPRFEAYAGQPLPCEVFGQEPIVTRTEACPLHYDFMRWFKRNVPGAKMNVVVTVDDTEALKTLVCEGTGISILPKACIEKELAEGKLLAFELDGAMPYRLYFVSKKKYLSPMQTVFKDFIWSEIAGN